MLDAGLPRPEAEAAVAPALDAPALRSLMQYSERPVALARLLDVPLLVIPRPIDEIAGQRVQQRADALLAERPAASLADLAALRAGGQGQLLVLGSSLTVAIGLRVYAEHLESLGIEVATLTATT